MEGPPDDLTGSITLLLRKIRDGDKEAQSSLFLRVYPELRRLAQSMIAEQRRTSMTPDGTGLVNDACCRLLEREKLSAEDRRHFFFLLGRAMRDELAEQARTNLAHKRGGNHHRVEMDPAQIRDSGVTQDRAEIREAIARFREVDPDGADVAELRFLHGFTLEATAEQLGTTVPIVRRHWSYAKAWLKDHLEGHLPDDDRPGPEEFTPSSGEVA